MSINDIKEPIESIDISSELPLKREAVLEFDSHLGVISDLQPHPVFSADDIATFLRPFESFIISEYKVNG